MITTLAVAGDRSLRDVTVSLGPRNVVTGGNGSGKSRLYRALQLLADVALWRVVASLAIERGLASTLWAGPEKFSCDMRSGAVPEQAPWAKARSASGSVSLPRIWVKPSTSARRSPSATRFSHGSEIKVEAMWRGPMFARTNRDGALVERADLRVVIGAQGGDERALVGVAAKPRRRMGLAGRPADPPAGRERVRSERHERQSARAVSRGRVYAAPAPGLRSRFSTMRADLPLRPRR